MDGKPDSSIPAAAPRARVRVAAGASGSGWDRARRWRHLVDGSCTSSGSCRPLSEIAFIARLKNEQRVVTGMVLRMDSIRLTSFVSAGYLIARVATWLVLIALMLTDAGPIGQELFFVTVIAFVLIYMNQLIRDLDNPFEYRLGVRGAADVSLLQIQRVERRLDRLLGSLGESAAADSSDAVRSAPQGSSVTQG